MPVRERRASRALLASLATLILLLAALASPVSAAPTPDPRVIGGEPADFGEYPFMVAVLFEPRAGTDFDKQFCGGSLIASRWVLTAAHCVDGIDDPDDLAVAVARNNLDSTQGVRVGVRSIHVHPDWNPNILSPDAALLELARPVNGIDPIRLAGPADDVFEAPGTQLTAIGWGNVDGRPNKASFPDELREVVVPVVDDVECNHANKGFVIADTMLCAGRDGVDTCQGDSGGPLFATTANGTEIQVGITSWGFGCAKHHFPGVYGEVNSPTIRSFIADVAGV